MRAIAVSAVAVLLVWQITYRSFAAFLADFAPETALVLRPTEPTALLNLADKSLNRALADKQEASSATNGPGEARNQIGGFATLGREVVAGKWVGHTADS